MCSVCSVNFNVSLFGPGNARVAQSVERKTLNLIRDVIFTIVYAVTFVQGDMDASMF